VVIAIALLVLGVASLIHGPITVRIGHFTLTPASFIITLIIAAIVGFIAEFIVGWRLPFGLIGAIIVATIGIWLTSVIFITGLPDIVVLGIPLIRALVSAIIFVALWHLLTYGLWRGRRRLYR
jgi:uncharacterized membrane protein YeaQ/YmgE (transglycosylase-associated protein family)